MTQVRPNHRSAEGKWVIPGSMVSVRFQDVQSAPSLCSASDPSCVAPPEFYGCDNEKCPPTTVVIATYPNIYNPFVTAEPDFPSSMPYTASLNPAALDLLTDVHIIRLEGGVWDERRALRMLYVQINFSYVAPAANPIRPDEDFDPICVQFVTNGSRWTEEGCQCLNRACSECNCSYADVERMIDVGNRTTQSSAPGRQGRRHHLGGGMGARSAARRQGVAEEDEENSGPTRRKVILKQDFMSIAVRRRRKCQVSYGADGVVECSGHGNCLDGRCECGGGWAGPICNNSCVDCSGHGSCSPVDGRCICYPGWAGPACTIQPEITRFTPTYAPAVAEDSRGRVVNIDVQGTGFGDTDSTPSVKIGDSFCRQSLWLSPTRIICRLAPGVGEFQTVTVFAGVCVCVCVCVCV